jgi:hypothetical protein
MPTKKDNLPTKKEKENLLFDWILLSQVPETEGNSAIGW